MGTTILHTDGSLQSEVPPRLEVGDHPSTPSVSKLLGIDFRVEYRSGQTNEVADALSRRDMDNSGLYTISEPTFQLFDELRQATTTHPALAALHDEIQAGSRTTSWTLVDDIVFFNNHVYLPSGSSILQSVLTATHDIGHEGADTTLHRFRRDYYTPHERTIIQDMARYCIMCQAASETRLNTSIQLNFSFPCQYQLQCVRHLHGLCGGTTKSRRQICHTLGSGSILEVSALNRAMPPLLGRNRRNGLLLRHCTTTRSTDFDRLRSRSGLHVHLLDDTLQVAGLKLSMSSAFHPQSDGQTEAVNKATNMYLRCLTGDRPRQWLRWLP